LNGNHLSFSFDKHALDLGRPIEILKIVAISTSIPEKEYKDTATLYWEFVILILTQRIFNYCKYI
jgi:hypothetical protein